MPAASWDQLEQAIERLHDVARRPLGVREFYRCLLDELTAALDAPGGAVWRGAERGRPELLLQSRADSDDVDRAARAAAVVRAAVGGEMATASLGDGLEGIYCPVEAQGASGGAVPAMSTAVL